MSTTKNTWKTIAIGFIILTVAFGAISAAALYETTSLNNDKTNLQNSQTSLQGQYNALKAQDDQDKASITLLQSALAANKTLILQLQKTISDDQTQINYLTIQLNGNVTLVAQLQAKITDLNSQIVKLQQQIVYLQGQYNLALAELQTLEKADVQALVSYTITPSSCIFPIGNICLFGASDGSGTVNAVAFANFGNITALAPTLKVTFSGGGTLPCTVSLSLGMSVAGRTINGLTPTSNNSCDTGPWPATATIATWAVVWT